MTLLMTCMAAIVTTVIWYNSERARTCKLGTLCYLYWGASIMWMVDAVAEYLEMGAEYFAPALEDMINDAFLGASVIVLGMIIWLVVLLVKDPMGVVKKSLARG